MVLKVFTKGDDSESRQAIDLGKEMEDRDYNVEYLDADDAEITQQMQLYDIYSYPSFIVLRDDGSEVECWRGIVPLKDDILSFLNR